jgi:hypothetical protein
MVHYSKKKKKRQVYTPLMKFGPMVESRGYPGLPVLDPKTPKNGSFSKNALFQLFSPFDLT